MDGLCPEGLHWDALVKKCMSCRLACQQPHVTSKCTSYCESAHCKALPGHYYDMLLKKCVRCADICGKHPAECSQHCQTLPSPVTTKMLLAEVTHNSRELPVTTALEDSNIFLYFLLAFSMVLVVTSLSLALAVFPRRSRAKPSNPGPKETSRQECVVKPEEEVGLPHGQQSSKDFVTSPSRPTEPSDDSSPTETCVCVHCFPDLKALGQGNERPLKAPFTFYQQAILHRAETERPQNKEGGPLWTGGSPHTSGLEVHEEAAVG